MSQFVMPSLGADMKSAVLMEWKVHEGDRVHKGDILAEVETSKGVIEIEVFEDGIVEKLLVEEETECAVGTPLALIRSEGESTSDSAVSETSPPPPLEPPVSQTAAAVGAESTEPPPPRERVKASPAARKKARELGIDLFSIAGAGEEVHLSDLETVPPPPPPVSGMRQAIARAMSLSNAQIPHYYLSMPINMTPALRWLSDLNASRPIEQRILPAALLIRAVVRALQVVPELNGFWSDDAPALRHEIHPGIAIALRKEGLITPALMNAGELNLEQTMEALSDLISRCRAGKLRGSEMTQQTVTITNLGDLGVQSVYGVIYPPQLALVGLGRITDEPWADGDALCVRKVMHATLAADHRATDGRTGGQFLEELDRLLQNPQELL